MTPSFDPLLEFWFESAYPDKMATHRQEWWIKDKDFDQRIHDDFADLLDCADQGKLESWKDTPLGCTALMILFDQFPRNMFRDTPKAFAYDEKARNLCRYVLAQGFDKTLPMGPRLFLYLPLEHSENITDQQDCLKLITDLGDEDYLKFARQHHDIIERFGRFPHRNAILGRASTEAEIEFLQQPNSSF